MIHDSLSDVEFSLVSVCVYHGHGSNDYPLGLYLFYWCFFNFNCRYSVVYVFVTYQDILRCSRLKGSDPASQWGSWDPTLREGTVGPLLLHLVV